MSRKYLNDIGIGDTGMIIDSDDARWESWNQEIKTYGFASYETWCMDFMFICWLYERLKRFLDVNCIDLNYHKFDFKGKEYTQKELIDMMIRGCELEFDREFKHKSLTADENGIVSNIPWIWATVMPAMWW